MSRFKNRKVGAKGFLCIVCNAEDTARKLHPAFKTFKSHDDKCTWAKVVLDDVAKVLAITLITIGLKNCR